MKCGIKLDSGLRLYLQTDQLLTLTLDKISKREYSMKYILKHTVLKVTVTV